ncbi:MAG: DUF420 domain-containing protein [Flavobacteriaceae bacterium]
MKTAKNLKLKNWIIVLSVLIPIVVAALFVIKIPGIGPFYELPPIYAAVNAFTAVMLVYALIAIRKGNVEGHKQAVFTAMYASLVFLVLYVFYHMTSEPTVYGGEGALKYIYYFILISHILLSIIVIPFVLITFSRGWFGQYEAHKKIAKYTFPLWLYVAVTGVIVYFLIAPYYGV